MFDVSVTIWSHAQMLAMRTRPYSNWRKRGMVRLMKLKSGIAIGSLMLLSLKAYKLI